MIALINDIDELLLQQQEKEVRKTQEVLTRSIWNQLLGLAGNNLWCGETNDKQLNLKDISKNVDPTCKRKIEENVNVVGQM